MHSDFNAMQVHMKTAKANINNIFPQTWQRSSTNWSKPQFNQKANRKYNKQKVIMIQTSSDEPSPKSNHEQITIYNLIPQGKPIININITPSKQKANHIFVQHANVQKNSFRSRPSQMASKSANKLKPYNFSSSYESGNIEQALEESPGIYKLKVRTDTNSAHQSQWFYFKVKGIKEGTFKIEGFRKNDSLFNYGMQVCVKQQGDWKRGGTNISYYKIRQRYYALTFHFVFENPQVTTEIAYCYPYSYTQMKKDLYFMLKFNKQIKNELITKTILGNDVNCLTFGYEPNKPKQIIFITCRVHPGQTVSSHILNGFLKALNQNVPQTQLLLEKFQIKIIPMLNPDGVKLGNYRYSFAGRDLNRSWKHPNVRITPEISCTKSYLEKYTKRVVMYIDLHGHSRKKGVFFFGCQLDKQDKSVRQFPYLMSKICQDYSYPKCNFTVNRAKEGTARISLWNSLRIPYIYTIESSFCGNQKSKTNYSILDFQNIGSKLLEGLAIFFSEGTQNTTFQQLKRTSYQQLQKQEEFIEDFNNEDSSQSEPSQGKLSDTQVLKLIQQFQYTQKIQKSKQNNLQDQRKLYSNSVAESKRIRKRINNSLRSTNNAISVYKEEFLQRKNRGKNRIAQMEIEKDTRQANSKKSQSNSKKTIKTREIKPEEVSAENKYQKIKISKKTCAATSPKSTISTIVMDDQFLRNGNYGTQFLRMKKYTQKLRRQREKEGQQSKWTIQISDFEPSKTPQQILVIRPLKSQKNIGNDIFEYTAFSRFRNFNLTSQSKR